MLIDSQEEKYEWFLNQFDAALEFMAPVPPLFTFELRPQRAQIHTTSDGHNISHSTLVAHSENYVNLWRRYFLRCAVCPTIKLRGAKYNLFCMLRRIFKSHTLCLIMVPVHLLTFLKVSNSTVRSISWFYGILVFNLKPHEATITTHKWLTQGSTIQLTLTITSCPTVYISPACFISKRSFSEVWDINCILEASIRVLSLSPNRSQYL